MWFVALPIRILINHLFRFAFRRLYITFVVKSIFMDPLHKKLICFLLILGGIALSGGALYGFWSLYHAYSTHERVVGVIQKTSTERVHRHRKVRFEHEMLIKYSTDKYGDCYVSKKYYWPFRQVGDEVTVLCRPQYTNDVRLPGDECWIWGIMLACGLVCAGGAWVMLRSQKSGEEQNCN